LKDYRGNYNNKRKCKKEEAEDDFKQTEEIESVASWACYIFIIE
jgi:hypothetical protein